MNRILLFLSLIISHSLFGQYSNLKHLSKNLDLSSDVVYQVFQDSKGFVWFATDKGVNRYDSKTIEYFTTKDGLSGNEVLKIYEDSNQRIWFLTYNGKLSYWLHGTFYNAKNDTSLAQLNSRSFFRCFYEDQNNTVWFGNNLSGLYGLDTNGIVTHHVNKECKRIIYISSSPSGNLRFLTNNSAKSTGTIYELVNGLPKKIYEFKLNQNDLINAIQPLTTKLYFYSLNQNLFAIDPISWEICWQKKISNYNIISISPSCKNGLWIGTRKGAYHISFNGMKIDSIPFVKSVTSVLCDQENNRWFSSLKEGLYVDYNLITTSYGKENKIGDQHVVLQNQNRLVFGGQQLQLNYLHNGTIKTSKLPRRELENEHSAQRITSLIKGFGNNVLVGSDEGLFYGQNGYFTRLIETPVKSLYLESNGDLYISVTNNLTVKYSLNNLLGQRKLAISENEAKQHIVLRNVVSTFLRRTPFSILMGTNSGLIELKTDSITGIQNKNTLLTNKIVELIELTNENILIITEDKGVWELKNNQTNQLVSSKALNYSLITSASMQGNDILWLGGVSGIFKLDFSKLQTKIDQFNTFHGLGSDRVNDLYFANDTIWIAHSEGITAFPSRYQSDTLPPLLYLNKLIVNGREIKSKELDQLKYHQNNVSFYLTGISYKNQGDLLFNYELIGGREPVRHTTSSRMIEFPALQDGSYTFKVFAQDRFGNESEPIPISFIIQKPWWNSWSFRGVLFTFLIGVIYLFFRFQILSYNRHVIARILENVERRLTREKYIMVKSITDGGDVKINLSDILWIEAAREYVEFHTIETKIVARSSMKELEKSLSEESDIIRIHKSYMINISKADSVKWNVVEIKSHSIPIGRTYSNVLRTYRKDMVKRAIN